MRIKRKSNVEEQVLEWEHSNSFHPKKKEKTHMPPKHIKKFFFSFYRFLSLSAWL